MSITVRRLSYEALRQIAQDFADQHNPSGTIPVPIESIIEFKYKIDICPECSLKSICDVDAFPNASCTTIHVDAGVYLSGNDSRYRFSLAHELSHVILHREIVACLPFRTIGEWKTAYLSIPEEQRGWIEYQAYALGGLLLVPGAQLKAEYEKMVEGFRSRKPDPNFIDSTRFMVHNKLGQRFRVSSEVIDKRCEKDGLALN